MFLVITLKLRVGLKKISENPLRVQLSSIWTQRFFFQTTQSWSLRTDFNKGEPTLKVIFFAMSLRKNQSVFEWRQIRKHILEFG